MRQDLYGPNGVSGCPSVPGEPPWREPYGAVPPQSSGGIAPLRRAAPGRTRRVTPAPRRAGNGKRFGLLLALILLLTGGGVLLNGGLPAFHTPFGAVGELWDYIVPGYGWDYYAGEDWSAELKNTTVERAPTGDGTTLALVPAEGNTLPAQEIYARVAPSVVGVRAVLEDGIALGTGIIMSSDGYIITNAHVIAGAGRVSVTLSDDSGRTEARLVGYDGPTDLAVLKIDAKDLPVAQFGDSSSLRVGDPAYAIGNPLGEELRGTMTDGIISAIDRVVSTDGGDMTLLQTTAALNSGNSGGALINAAGQVVGVTNMKMMSDWETIEGLGFAIPTSLAKEVVDQIIASGSYEGTASIGITVRTQPAAPNTPAGVYVLEVEEASDAYAQGIRPGDVIVEAGGSAVTSTQELKDAKAGLKVGDALELVVWNGTGFRNVTVKLVGSNQL